MPAGTRSGLTSSHGGWADLGRRAALLGSVALGAVALLLYQSALWLPQPPPPVKLALGLFGVLAVYRPSQALLIATGLTPLAAVIWPAAGMTPMRGAEALPLAVVAGWYLKGGAARQGGADPLLARTSLLFGLTVVAAWIEIFTPQALTWSGPWTPTQASLRFFSMAYLGSSAPDGLHACGLLVIGVALAYATACMSRRDAQLPGRVVRMTVAGGLGAAALSLFRVGAAIARTDDPATLLERLAVGDIRLSMHVPDVNAAGSYFVLIAVLALGLAVSARRAWPWLAAGGMAVVALLISGSRAAFFAGAAVTIAGLAFAVWRRFAPLRRRATLLLGIALSLMVLTLAVIQPVAGREAVSSLWIRYHFTETSVKMIASSPVFGVGLGRYITRSSQFMPRELRRLYRRENAHNYLLQVTAELGLVGGLLFAVIVFVPLARGGRALVGKAGTDPELLGVTAGLAAFVITCLSGHPLLLNQIAYPFWILLGLISGIVLRGRDELAAASGVAVPPSRLTPVATWAAATVGILLVLSIPVRVQTAARNTSFSRVSYGFHDWEVDNRGQRFRWTTDRATFYVPTGVRTVEIPLRAWNPAGWRSTSVDVDVNGRRMNQLDLDHSSWTAVVLRLPPRAPDRYWRIDMRVDPTGRPNRINPRLTDDRLLGVRVGEIQLTPNPDKRAAEDRADR
jgi:O-antigen ligase